MTDSASPQHSATIRAKPAMSPLEVLASELGLVAAQIDRETRLRLDAGLADIRRATSDMELRFERLERSLLERISISEPAKTEKPRLRVPAGSSKS